MICDMIAVPNYFASAVDDNAGLTNEYISFSEETDMSQGKSHSLELGPDALVMLQFQCRL